MLFHARIFSSSINFKICTNMQENDKVCLLLCIPRFIMSCNSGYGLDDIFTTTSINDDSTIYFLNDSCEITKLFGTTSTWTLQNIRCSSYIYLKLGGTVVNNYNGNMLTLCIGSNGGYLSRIYGSAPIKCGESLKITYNISQTVPNITPSTLLQDIDGIFDIHRDKDDYCVCRNDGLGGGVCPNIGPSL